ncbi:MAG: hypothetical protein GY705_02790, partial [Bacteroidetes bacterium]|nr:hypothetical protein [Bacteroidota bacterium]
EGKKSERKLFEVDVDGTYKFLVFNGTEKLPPNYVPALDAGSLDSKVVKNEKYFFMTEGKLLEIPGSKKKAEKIFGRYASARKFLKSGRMSFKSKEQLRALVKFMNQSKLKS